MGIKQDIINWLNVTDIPLAVIARETNISRNTLYSWKQGRASDIRDSNINKVAEVFGNQINSTSSETTMGTTHEPKEESIMNQTPHPPNESANDLSYAGLLVEKVKNLTKENEILQHMLKHNPWSDTIYEQLEADFKTNVLITYNDGKLKRCIKNVKGIDNCEKFTAKQKNIYWNLISVDKWYAMNNHPINGIIEKSSLEQIQGYTRYLLPIVNALKIMVGGAISLPIWYDFNKPSSTLEPDIVKTQCYMKVHWDESPKRIETKNLIID